MTDNLVEGNVMGDLLTTSEYSNYVRPLKAPAPVRNVAEGEIPAPEILGAENYTISAEHARQGIEVSAGPYVGMREGDELSVYCLSAAPMGSVIKHFLIEVRDVGLPVRFFIEPNEVLLSSNSTLYLLTRVSSAGVDRLGLCGAYEVQGALPGLIVNDSWGARYDVYPVPYEDPAQKIAMTIPGLSTVDEDDYQVVFNVGSQRPVLNDYALFERRMENRPFEIGVIAGSPQWAGRPIGMTSISLVEKPDGTLLSGPRVQFYFYQRQLGLARSH